MSQLSVKLSLKLSFKADTEQRTKGFIGLQVGEKDCGYDGKEI